MFRIVDGKGIANLPKDENVETPSDPGQRPQVFLSKLTTHVDQHVVAQIQGCNDNDHEQGQVEAQIPVEVS